MALDSNLGSDNAIRSKAEESGLAKQFGDSFLAEAQREIAAVRQIGDRSVDLSAIEQPPEATTTSGWHAQLLGRAIADLIPVAATGLAVRFGGRALGRLSMGEEELAKISTVPGLDVGEAAATGLLTGSLLTPTAPGSDMLYDRMLSGTLSAGSFSAMTLIGKGTTSLGRGMDLKSLSNPIVSGFVSGIPSGALLAELTSLKDTGSFTTDGKQILKSVYEVSLLGGTFGATTSLSGKMHETYFSSRAKLNKIFSDESDKSVIARIDYLSMRPFNLDPLAKLAKSEPSGKEMVSRLIGSGARQYQLTEERLQKFAQIDNEMHPDADTYKRLTKLEEEGLSLGLLATYLRDNLISREKTVSLIKSGASAEELEPARLLRSGATRETLRRESRSFFSSANCCRRKEGRTVSHNQRCLWRRNIGTSA